LRKIVIIILLLFSISLFPENIGFNFAFELRGLVFAIGVAALVCSLILKMLVPTNRDARKYIQINNLYIFGNCWNNKFKLTSIDLAYIAVTLLTVISFLTKAVSVYAFHNTFVQVGMTIVYFFVRTTKVTKNTKKIRTYNSPVNFIKVQRTKNQILISIVGIGFIVALIGLIQFVLGKPIVSTFGRTSYLGCFLAMNAAIAFGLLLATTESKGLSKVKGRKVEGQKLFALLAFVVIFGVTLLTKSRTAMIALAIVLPIIIIAMKTLRLKEKKINLFKSKRSKIILCLGVLVAALLIFSGCKYLYKLKPMSASGRVLIWKVAAKMFRRNSVTGVSFGNFANSYNLYQAEYFVSGKGSVINKMTAGQVRHAYNWYLETAAEFGIFGLAVFGIFWWLILVEIFKILKPHKRHKKTEVNYLNIGMSGAVLCFMIMSLFQFPNKIIPTYLMFNFALAWIVNANLEENNKNQIINNK